MTLQDDQHPRRPVLLQAIPFCAMLLLLFAAAAMSQFAPTEILTGVLFMVGIPMAFGGIWMSLIGDETGFSIKGCLFWPLALTIISVTCVWVLNEGFACVAMTSLIWFVAGIGGALVALWYRWQRKRSEQGKSSFYSAAWLALPLMAAAIVEPVATDDYRTVSRSVVVDASPEQVWPMLLSIENVGADEGRWNFTQDVIGIPRPTDARLIMQNGQLIRKARWGRDIRFDEAVTTIKPNREIRWAFRFPDKSISAYTDRHIHPDSDLLSIETGGYRLEPLPSGKTRITLWTHYRQRVRIPFYTAWWGERFLGDIQDNVLAIISGRMNRKSNPATPAAAAY